MSDNRVELSVNTEVFEKMAEIAAKEVEGVAGLSKKQVDLKGIIKNKTAFKGVRVEDINGAIEITVYLCVKKDADVKAVSEKVQENVKEKIQTMTGNAVTKVNICVEDIEIAEQEEQ